MTMLMIEDDSDNNDDDDIGSVVNHVSEDDYVTMCFLVVFCSK